MDIFDTRPYILKHIAIINAMLIFQKNDGGKVIYQAASSSHAGLPKVNKTLETYPPSNSQKNNRNKTIEGER